ncbi:thiaminase II [Kordia sp.]|uniref:thiaminase II n=1 Tax=Kordia sp. TaxID=1965332 RepID=UPI003D2D7F24
MTWSDKSWKTIEPIFNSILKMPFIQELMNGNLNKEKFKFYMQQDSKYLENFGKTLSLLASKSYNIKETISLLHFAETAIIAERELHEFYFKDFNIVPSAVIEPVIHHYISHIKAISAFESIEVGMASVLPCFWIYKKVGEYIYENQKSKNNPYQKWIDTYAGNDFDFIVKDAISICDNLALHASTKNQTRMTEVFITSARLEFEFWDSSYKMKKWQSFE